MGQITRYSVVVESVHVDTVLADADEIEIRGFTSGMVYIPSGSSIATITWYAAAEPGGTYIAVENGSGAAVTSTVDAATAVAIPASCMSAGALKAVGSADGTMDVSLKG